jgi:predicted helicase
MAKLEPDDKYNWIMEGIHREFTTLFPLGTKEAKSTYFAETSVIFKVYSGGVKTNRDNWVYDFNRQSLITKLQKFIETYNNDVDRWRRRSSNVTTIDDFVTYNNESIKWSGDLKIHLERGRYASYSEQKIRHSLYRPFVKQHLYFDSILNNRRYLQYLFFPDPTTELENIVIVVSDIGYRAPFSVLATNIIPDLHLLATSDAFQCFPYYTYSPDGTNSQENITDWALRVGAINVARTVLP